MPNDVLVPCSAPSAAVRLFETQPPLIEGGVTVERYTTSQHTVFEKHIATSGVAHWFRVEKAAK